VALNYAYKNPLVNTLIKLCQFPVTPADTGRQQAPGAAINYWFTCLKSNPFQLSFLKPDGEKNNSAVDQ
jgi:hypothetical protein